MGPSPLMGDKALLVESSKPTHRMYVKEKNSFKYIDEGQGEVLLLFHGLFGALSNWDTVVSEFKSRYRVVIPMLPLHDIPIKKAGLDGLMEFLDEFIQELHIENYVIMGNSLGGHLALMCALKYPHDVKGLVLTGSSGLFENSNGGSYPRRGSYEYIKQRVLDSFYNTSVVTQEYIEEVFATTKSIPTCMRIVAIAKSAQRHNMASDIPNIKIPTLLIWGLNDTITPPMVAHEFKKLLPKVSLKFLDKCCHAPMMEHPNQFNAIVEAWLDKSFIKKSAA